MADTPIQDRRFTLDDVPVDISLFCLGNVLDEEQMLAIGDLKVGEEMRFGGGAAPIYTLRRVATCGCRKEHETLEEWETAHGAAF